MQYKLTVTWLVLVWLAASGCSQERSRVPEIGADKAGNYQAMIDHARSRQTVADTLSAIKNGVEQFRSQVGRLPTNLVELIERGYLKTLPSAPEGHAYAYDPIHGNVVLVDQLQQAREAAVNSDTARKPNQ